MSSSNSSAPVSSSPPQESSTAPASSSTPVTTSESSTQVTTSTTSAAPTSSTSSTPLSTSSPTSTTSTTESTSSTPTGTTSTAAATTSSAPSVSSTPLVTSSGGGVVTVTVGASQTTSRFLGGTSTLAGPGSTHTSKNNGFLSNTGAVAGVFTVVGLVGLAGLVGLILLCLRRRRAQRFDRELTVAAAEANMQAARNAPFNDDEFDDYAHSGGTHGAYDQPPLGAAGAGYGAYEDTGAYPLRERKMSQGTTGTGGAGIAGFGAHRQIQGLQNPYADPGSRYPPPPQDPNSYQSHDPSYGFNSMSGPMDGPYPAAPHRQDHYSGGYDQPNYPPVAVSTGIQRQLSQTHSRHASYSEDAYGGTAGEEEEIPPLPTPRHQGDMRASSGTVDDEEEYRGGSGRILKVANQ